MDAAIAGLIGGVVGASASLLGLWIQQHHETKRQRVNVAANLGLAEYQHDLELARRGGGGVVAPLAGYVIFHSRFLDTLAEGPVTAEQVRALTQERDRVLAAFPGAPQE